MNKTALAINMLQILKSQGLIKKQRLAELLETNIRNIIELKKELEIAGYLIEVKNGKNGGYRLNDEHLLPISPLTNDEINALNNAYHYLKQSSIYLKDRNFDQAFIKVIANHIQTQDSLHPLIIQTQLSMSLELLYRYYQMIKEAISERFRLEIAYRPQNKKIKRWIFHPYELFQYQGMWYVLGFRQADQKDKAKTITLKLNRIVSLNKLEIPFSIPDGFNIKAHVSQFGMKIDKKEEVVLKIKNRYYVSEYVYGEEQKIVELDDDTILLSVVMQNELTIKQLVNSLGADCEVIKPNWLKKAILDQSIAIIDIYKKSA
ncbi:MAG: WYL domain-containing protein [Erysipelotrichaceae bacterium]|nr:WYL domain-containing protein [Erysipelotrichaceae bacterium]MDD4642047.1 WYL domain-containing protein [Erysipelotrichaceae bacterium]